MKNSSDDTFLRNGPNIVSVTAKHKNTEKILEKADLKRKQDEKGARG